jgi:hypothetical protein
MRIDETVFQQYDTPAVDAWMRGKKPDGYAMRRAVWKFGSFTEYVEAASGVAGHDGDDGNRASRNNADTYSRFCDTENFDQARKLALFGWPEGTRQISTMSAAMSGTMSIPKYGMDLQLTGGAVDVPTFLTGEPECMWAWTESSARRAAKIVVEGAVNAGMQASEIFRRGSTIVSLVDALEAGGVSTEVELRYTLRDGGYSHHVQHRVTLKNTTEPLDIAAIAFAIAHPSSLRRVCFGVMERTSKRVRDAFGFWRRGGYGYVAASDPAEFTEGEVLVSGNQLTSSMFDNMQWIKATAATFGVEVE